MLPLFLVFTFSLINGEKTVMTKSGPVRGITLNKGNVEGFLGIPYAEPPLGNLRFSKPVPKSQWTRTFDATKLPPACLQVNKRIRMDEDCLYLNLWVPKSQTVSKAVMVYIYGGSFRSGGSNFKIYNGANLAEHGDVIVASMNYRLGILGFFSAFSEDAPGNIGLYDQLLAIQWIKDNANYFGGDSNNIVLFGQSAGAFAISAFIVSPLSRNLFNRAILQSGAANGPELINLNKMLREGSQLISTLVDCADDQEELYRNPKKVVECMKKLPAETFIDNDVIPSSNISKMVPRVGEDVIPVNPIDILRQGEFKDIDTLFGVTADEDSIYVSSQIGISYKNIDPDAFNETDARQFIQYLINDDNQKIIENYFERVKEEYRYTYLNAVSDIIGDIIITCPTVFHADFQSLKHHPVYFYVFNYRPPSTLFPEWAGVPHASELPYIFGNEVLGKFSKYEKNLSKDMMDMWVAFAKTGNPSIPGEFTWPRYTYKDPKHVIISLRDRIGFKPDNYRCEAWRRLFNATIDK